jgi:hypothetical protein
LISSFERRGWIRVKRKEKRTTEEVSSKYDWGIEE